MAMLVKGLLLLVLVWGWLLPVPAQAARASDDAAPMVMATELSGAELGEFVQAYQAARDLRVEAEADMVKAIEAAGLTVEEFNTIAQEIESDRSDATPQFAPTLEAILALRQKAETAMEEAIQSAGLGLDRFAQILQQSAQDPGLQHRISTLLEKS